jgi:predicted HAD superfamily Cof-like phosphohydrolase
MNVLEDIVQWQIDAGRKIAVDHTAISKYVGYGLEETAEELRDGGLADRVGGIVGMLERWSNALKALKAGQSYKQYNAEERLAIADAACDQICFAIGKLMACGYDPIKALQAVADSNNSKRNSDGSFSYDEHGKVTKPAHYKLPDLASAMQD